MAQMEAWRAPDRPVKYVFECGPGRLDLTAAASLEPSVPNPIFEPSRDKVDLKGKQHEGVIQLQSADLLAYELRKHRRDLFSTAGVKHRGSFFEMMKAQMLFMRVFNLAVC